MPPTKTATFALVAALILSTSACGSTSASSPTSNSTSADRPPSSAPPATGDKLDAAQCKDPAFQQTHADFCANAGTATQGAADSVAVFAESGLRARVVSVKIAPADATRPGKPGETQLVTVTTELTNTAAEPYVFPTASGAVTEMLLHGKDLYEATSWTVLTGGRADLPARLSPGSTATTISQFTAPPSVPLAFGFSPNSGALPTYTFTGIETLAK